MNEKQLQLLEEILDQQDRWVRITEAGILRNEEKFERERAKYRRRNILLRARAENKATQSDELAARMYFSAIAPVSGETLKYCIKSALEQRMCLWGSTETSNWEEYLVREKAVWKCRKN